LPVSVKEAPDAPALILSHAAPKLAVSVSTDPSFTKRPQHELALQAMGFGWEYADSRDETIQMLRTTDSQVVYFYCHGGLTAENFPYLSVGPPGESRFTRSNLRDYHIRWRDVRPLIFINGCHTTALTPEAAIDLVSGFVETSHAAGVVGTEITIFEPIAVAFAEEFFDRFLKRWQTMGEAVRGARLKMLKDGNPLGLVYIPYALPGLRVTPTPN
jgi:CHAT domain-containing protein